MPSNESQGGLTSAESGQVRKDYAPQFHRPTNRGAWVIAYTLLILQGVFFVGITGSLIYLANKADHPHGVTGHP